MRFASYPCSAGGLSDTRIPVVRRMSGEPSLLRHALQSVRTKTLRTITLGTMTTKSKLLPPLTLAATVSGEDLACGDFVAILSETVEAPSYLWAASDTSLSPYEMVRLRLIPIDAGQPLKVIAICLPFVYAKSPQGELTTLDVRQMQLVRLDRKCMKAVWKQLRTKTK